MVNSAETRVSAEFTIQIGGGLSQRAACARGPGGVKEQKFKEREFPKKEIDNNKDSEVSATTLEDFKIDKTYQN